MAFNTITLALDMAVAGLGLAYLPEDIVCQRLTTGDLMQVLGDWSPPASGYHIYYPSRRQPTPAFALLVDAIRSREAGLAVVEVVGESWQEHAGRGVARVKASRRLHHLVSKCPTRFLTASMASSSSE
jgi:hypothetical protein